LLSKRKSLQTEGGHVGKKEKSREEANEVSTREGITLALPIFCFQQKAHKKDKKVYSRRKGKSRPKG